MATELWSLSGRLQLFWESPVVAGAVLAVLGPWTHAVVDWKGGAWKKLLVLGLILAEFAVLSCLILTQSRGSLCAWMLATTASLVLAVIKHHPARWMFVTRSLCALAFIVFASLATAARGRIVGGILLHDQSVGNRLQIWSASLDMLWLNPWTGLGTGEAGWTYSQWFQPERTQYLYTGVLNSFLEIGIEQGVVILWLLLSGIMAIILYPWCARRRGEDPDPSDATTMLGLCSWASLTVYFTTNLFSSLHKSPTLITLASFDLLAFGVFVVLSGNRRATLRAVSWAFLLAAALLLMLRLTSSFSGRGISVTYDRGAMVLRKVKTPASYAAVLVDRSVLGALFGMKLRDFLGESEGYDAMVVFDPRFALPQNRLKPFKQVIVTGRCLRFLPQLNPAQPLNLLLINPEGAPERFPDAWKVRVWLSGADELGQNVKWLALAHPPNLTVLVQGKGGQLLAEGVGK